MAILDVDSLLEPVSEESPCGPNLEYDDAFASFEQAARGKPEQQYGDTIIPAEEPDWPEVRRLGIELVGRTKDLRVACQLARGLLQTDGFPDFAACLALVRGYLERYWTTVHPQLDPEDENDPTVRVNTVASLSDSSTTIKSLRTVPLVEARGLGRFSLREIGIANGEVSPLPDEDLPQIAAIEGAFAECELDQLRANTAAIRECLEHASTIESVVTERVGADRAVGMDDLRDTLQELFEILNENLTRRDVASAADSPTDEAGALSGQGQTPETAARLTGEIRSRDDVVAALDKICQYYNRCEPSSPVPLLLGRAKRLASKSFLEIVKDLTPEAVSQIQKLSGASDADSDD
jgi:type VI secretion system protein ImpA